MSRLWLVAFLTGPLGAVPAARLPVRFEPYNYGYVARTNAGASYLTRSGSLRLSAGLEMDLADGAALPSSVASGLLPGKANDLRGADPAGWRTGIPQYGKVRFSRVWKGIDLVYHGDGSRLEYDFVVAPGAPVGRIVLVFRGSSAVRLTAEGGLLIQAAGDEFCFRAPKIMQGGRRIAGRYRLLGQNRVDFQIGHYDHAQPLVIDPVLGYAALFGAQGGDPVQAVAVDPAGNVYIAGTTLSEIPLVNPVNGKQGTGNCSAEPGKMFYPCEDVYVAKFDPTGTKLLYSTYLGGDARDLAGGIAVGRDGSVYVTGETVPIGPALNYSAGQAWVMKLNPSGTVLSYNQNIGASTRANGVAVDGQGNAYIAGNSYSLSFPAVNAIQSKPPLTSLLVTHDGGDTWSSLNQNLPVLAVNSLAIDPTHASTLYAGTSSGVFQSLDGGVTWKQLLPAAISASQVSLDPKTPSTVYVLFTDSMNDGTQLAKSIDAGGTWQNLNSNLPAPRFPAPLRQFGGLAIDPSNPATLWLTDVPQGSPQIYESTDGGAHWVDAHDFPVFFIPGQGDSLMGGQIVVDPTNSARVYTCCAFQLTPVVPALFRTDDGGKTWVEGGHANIATLAVDPRNGATLYSTSGSGLLRSMDAGQTWANVPLPQVAFPTEFHGPAIDSSGALYLTNDAGLLLRSPDAGATWTISHGPWSNGSSTPEAKILALDPINASSTIYVSYPSGGGSPNLVQHAYAAKLDPSGTILWSTLIAGSQQDGALAIAVDGAGNPYVAGTTNSLDFPIVNAAQATRARAAGDGFDAFLTKIASDGSKLVYSTYLGGSGDDAATAVAVDSIGNAYIGGSTNLTDFPLVNPIPGGKGNTFAAKFDVTGQKVLLSTYLANTGPATALTLDPQGNLWVAGQAALGLPLLNPIQPSLGGSYLMELAPAGNGWAVSFSSYIGSQPDSIAALAATAGSIWMAGQAFSPDFLGDPSTMNLFAGFLARLDLVPSPATPGVPLIRSVYNSASYRLGDAVSPGEIVSLFGAEFAATTGSAAGFPLPQSLAGVSVTIGGIAAPLYYVGPGQINFQAPFELSPGNTSIVVNRGSQSSAARPIRVIAFSPGIFTGGPDAYNAPVVVHASDFSLVTPQNPAHASENLAIYCTGLGVTQPSVRSGDAAPPAPVPVKPLVEVVEDSRGAMVSYAGLAPGFAGLYQMNFQVPSNETPGIKALFVSIQGLYSNPVPLYVQ
ncbi:MAG TPA: SBBP repeat-containing protein [Bryobacteraceae bacterium]|nr:SBBP repeat-containing protein [Bryobacteraceae bacterium]